jgi:hypothetical protein
MSARNSKDIDFRTILNEDEILAARRRVDGLRRALYLATQTYDDTRELYQRYLEIVVTDDATRDARRDVEDALSQAEQRHLATRVLREEITRAMAQLAKAGSSKAPSAGVRSRGDGPSRRKRRDRGG